ncbi:MAG: hypothetical protein H7331_10560 [Bacteroidia bacterium]|nr:hypothetical protein [Bacteroidia bacterium]
MAFILNIATVNAQQKPWRIGLKLQPNVSVSYNSNKPNTDTNYFKIVPAKVSPAIGIAVNYATDKLIFEWDSYINFKKTSAKFGGYNYLIRMFQSNYSYMTYSVATLSNKLFAGYCVKSNSTPFYKIFVGPSVGYDIAEVTSGYGQGVVSGGSGRHPSVTQVGFESVAPSNFAVKINGLTTGITCKIRTELRNHKRFDYGLSFDYFHGTMPYIQAKAVINYFNVYQTLIKPKTHTIGIDFVYYFRPKKDRPVQKLKKKNE